MSDEIQVEIIEADPIEVEVSIFNGIIYTSEEGGSLAYVTAYPIGGHRAIVLNASQQAVYADCTNLAHANRVIGISTGAADQGALVTIKRSGEMTEPSWTWDVNLPVYLGANGLLIQAEPVEGFCLVLGFPVSATKLFVDIRESFILI